MTEPTPPPPHAPPQASPRPDAGPSAVVAHAQPSAVAAHAGPTPTAAGDAAVPTRALPPGAVVPELTRTVLAILALLALIVGTFWVLQPFIPALIWAVTIVIATWPLMLRMQALLWHRRALAVAAMTLALLLLFFVPLSLAIVTVVGNADVVIGWIRTASTWRPGEPPSWLVALPVVGSRLAAYWNELIDSGGGLLIGQVTPYVGTVATRLLKEAGALGAVGLQFLLTVVIAAILYARGETAAQAVRRFARRLAGERGVNIAELAAASIRGVAMGVVVTAVLQSVLGGIGLAVVGIPAATLLTALMFLLAIAQVGVVPVLLPAVAWLFWSGATGWGVALLVWTVFVGTMDNVVRPWLIQRGADLPLLLIFAGVIGGLFAFGLVGIFIGPVVLAVTYTLVKVWMAETPDRSGAHDA